MESKFVIPGDIISSAEEFLPSFGTYAENNLVYSSTIGELNLDVQNHVAKVFSKTRIIKMQGKGLIVLGVISDVFKQAALVELFPTKIKNSYCLPLAISAVIHIRNVANKYILNMREAFRVGDIVKARILEIEPTTVVLGTNEKNLGVIKAFCSNCRTPMIRSGYKVKCPSCNSLENRKLSIDYR
ncbi:MAG: exosome complex RNA-binding protein Csl4 [archaeon]